MTRSDRRLMGKISLITGSARGIGEAIAAKFAAEGSQVVMIDRNESELRSACDSIKANGGIAWPLTCDLRDECQVREMVQLVFRDWKAIHILVNNAAVFPERIPFHEVSAEQWYEVINVNLLGAFRCTREIVRKMIQAEIPARIINISSINSRRYRRRTYGQTQYNVSKAALDNLTKGLAMELAPYGIIVNGIAPGFVRTTLSSADSLDDIDFKREYIESGRIPLRRYGTPDDCANLALFLASDECTWMTGETICLDGGMNFIF